MSVTASAARDLDMDLGNLQVLGEGLLPGLGRIREAEPVFWSEAQQAWFVTRYADVQAGFEGRFPLSSVRLGKVAFAAIPEADWPRRVPLLTSATPNFSNMTDPPQHGVLRKPLNQAFTRPKVEVVREYVRARTRELLDQAAAAGRFEFIGLIGRPLTGGVIMHLMGMPEKYAARLFDWANGIVAALGTLRPSAELLEGGERAMREMDQAFTEQLERRRARPTDDLLSVMAAACEGEQAWTHAEFLGNCVNLLLAGHESTASTAAFAVAALAARPDQVDFMLRNRGRETEFVEELSRFVAMSASQTRVAAADFDWHGKRIKAGDIVYLWIGSANRDPRVFARPDELDLAAGKRETLVFGRGIHHCIGHFLAKLELGELLPAFFERFDVKVLDEPLRFSGGNSFRTLSELNVAVTPRH